jgi:hypothetical protein
MPCVALGRPSCGRADVPCVCIADLRWGTQLVHMPCVALGRPTCGRVLCCVWVPILRTCLALRWGAHLVDVPCVTLGRPTCGRALSLRCGRALGCPTCGRALRCVGAPNLRTCLALRLGIHLADACWIALGHPICGCADGPCVVYVPCVCVTDVRWGAQLADVPCVALGRKTCGRALCYVWAPILRTCLVLRWDAQPW